MKLHVRNDRSCIAHVTGLLHGQNDHCSRIAHVTGLLHGQNDHSCVAHVTGLLNGRNDHCSRIAHVTGLLHGRNDHCSRVAHVTGLLHGRNDHCSCVAHVTGLLHGRNDRSCIAHVTGLLHGRNDRSCIAHVTGLLHERNNIHGLFPSKILFNKTKSRNKYPFHSRVGLLVLETLIDVTGIYNLTAVKKRVKNFHMRSWSMKSNRMHTIVCFSHFIVENAICCAFWSCQLSVEFVEFVVCFAVLLGTWPLSFPNNSSHKY